MFAGLTNFALLMEAFDVSPKTMGTLLGADLSLISRWRTGSRRMMPGRHWASSIADCFLDLDSDHDPPLLGELLRSHQPERALDTRQQQLIALEEFLTDPKRATPQARQLTLSVLCRLMAPAGEKGASPPNDDAQCVVGRKATRQLLQQVMRNVLSQRTPQELLLLCPSNLELLLENMALTPLCMQQIQRAFHAGLRLTVVLSTDFKISSVSEIAGPWLVWHLHGYIHSHYFDSFWRPSNDDTILLIRGKMALRLSPGEHHNDVRARLHSHPEDLRQLESQFQHALVNAQRRSYDHLFESPRGHLAATGGFLSQPGYLFMRLPLLPLGEWARYARRFELSDREASYLRAEFPPLFAALAQAQEGPPIRHLYCSAAIDDALLEGWRQAPVLSSILGRRAIASAQAIVEQLLDIRRLLEINPRYEVCFLPEEAFANLSLHLCSWGPCCAVAWVNGKNAMAFSDYLCTSALSGYCQMVWDKIPSAIRLRSTSLKKIDAWLRRADELDVLSRHR